jgi:ketosteroid isomerase-like protein
METNCESYYIAPEFQHATIQYPMTSPAVLQSVAHEWFAAFNAHNLEKLLSLYDDNAQHFSPKLKIRHPETNGLIKGKDALRAWWRDAFNRLPTLNYEVVRLTPYENRVFMEYIRHVQGEEDLYVGEMLEMENEKIIASSVFHR